MSDLGDMRGEPWYMIPAFMFAMLFIALVSAVLAPFDWILSLFTKD